VDKDSVMTMS